MDKFLQEWVDKRLNDNEHGFALTISCLDSNLITPQNLYVLFNTHDKQDKIDLALDIFGIMQVKENKLRDDAVENLFRDILKFDDIKKMDIKGMILAKYAVKNGFKPHSNSLNLNINTSPPDSRSLAGIIDTVLSLVDVKKEDVSVTAEDNPEFTYRYYSFCSLSDLINLDENNIPVNDESIFSKNIRQEFSFYKSEKQKKLNSQLNQGRNTDYKI